MSLKKLFGIVKLITKFYRLLSSLFKLSLFSPKQRNKRTDERNLKIKDIKKARKGFFSMVVIVFMIMLMRMKFFIFTKA